MALQSTTFKKIPLTHPFTCHGCKEQGTGARYRCNECNINIHEFCANAPPSISHPCHNQHPLIFYYKLGTGFARSKCDVCGHSFKGFAYRCNVCNFNIHSCCAELPRELNFYGHPQHALKLFHGPPSAKGSSYTCGGCGKKGSSWVYHCAKCGYFLGKVCAQTAINGFQGIGAVRAKQSKFRTAARLATQAGEFFVSRLVQGLGEAVAGVILDNATRDFNPHPDQDNHTDH